MFLNPVDYKPGGGSWLLLIFPGSRTLTNLGAVLCLIEFQDWASMVSPLAVETFGDCSNAGHDGCSFVAAQAFLMLERVGSNDQLH